MKNKKKKTQNKTHKIGASFSGESLTNFSGLLPIYKFMNKIGLSHLIENKITLPKAYNTLFSLSQIIEATILGLLSGANRIIKIEKTTMDPLIQKLLNLHKHIDNDTFRIRFKRFNFKHTTEMLEVNASLSRKVHQRLKTEADIQDIDSSAVTVYGHQQQSAKGYNPMHKGKRSYHPLLAFLNSTREVMGAWLRPGNTHSVHDAPAFLAETTGRLPKTIKKLIIGADSGFFDDKVMALIEKHEEFQ